MYPGSIVVVDTPLPEILILYLPSFKLLGSIVATALLIVILSDLAVPALTLPTSSPA